MPIVSGYLTLEPTTFQVEIYRQLSSDPRVTLGRPMANLLPLVVSTRTVIEDREVWRQIAAVKGVLLQQIVHADFQDLHEELGSEKAVLVGDEAPDGGTI